MGQISWHSVCKSGMLIVNDGFLRRKYHSSHLFQGRAIIENKSFRKFTSSSLRSGFLKWEAFLLYWVLNGLQTDFAAVAERPRELEGSDRRILVNGRPRGGRPKHFADARNAGREPGSLFINAQLRPRITIPALGGFPLFQTINSD